MYIIKEKTKDNYIERVTPSIPHVTDIIKDAQRFETRDLALEELRWVTNSNNYEIIWVE